MATSTSPENIKVIIRCRPFNEREIKMKCKNVIKINARVCSCSITNPNADQKVKPKTFYFDGAYDIDSTTDQIYGDVVFPLIEVVWATKLKQ